MEATEDGGSQKIHGSNPALHTRSKLHLGSVASLPPGIVELLTENGVFDAENGEAYLILSDKIRVLRHISYEGDQAQGLKLLPQKEIELTNTQIKEIKIVAPKVSNTMYLSSKMINKIEAYQYKKGICIALVPHIDLVQSAFSQGYGGLTPRVGLTADWIIAPHWSVETSVDYLSTDVTVKKNFSALHLINLIPELGNIESVELTTSTLSSPVNLKYRWWLTHKNQLIVRAGYTPYFSINRQYQYRQPYPGRPAGSDKTISTLQHSDDVRFYGSTFHVGIGISKMIKKKNQLEADLFYERSPGGVGNEKLGIQLYGIRTSFSFRMK